LEVVKSRQKIERARNKRSRSRGAEKVTCSTTPPAVTKHTEAQTGVGVPRGSGLVELLLHAGELAFLLRRQGGASGGCKYSPHVLLLRRVLALRAPRLVLQPGMRGAVPRKHKQDMMQGEGGKG